MWLLVVGGCTVGTRIQVSRKVCLSCASFAGRLLCHDGAVLLARCPSTTLGTIKKHLPLPVSPAVNCTPMPLPGRVLSRKLQSFTSSRAANDAAPVESARQQTSSPVVTRPVDARVDAADSFLLPVDLGSSSQKREATKETVLFSSAGPLFADLFF